MNISAPTGSITGNIVDRNSNHPLSYTTVAVIDSPSGKTISGTLSGKSGDFTIKNLPTGHFILTFESIGYRTYTQKNVLLTDTRRPLVVDTVKLEPSAQQLEAVTVTSKTPVVENKIDRIVFNVASDVTSQGGVALDVLKKVPQVTVDVDGNVELQGNSGVRFLINGKPSVIFGSSLADALASIPASQIKSIEVITSPGAKYDAQGTGGIINIILKDNKLQGINGNINISAGSRLENGSANLNVKKGNIGINLFFSGNAQLNTTTRNSLNRLSSDSTAKSKSRLLQNGQSDFHRNGYQSGLGLDWDLSPKDNLTATFGYQHFGNRNQAQTDQQQVMTDLSGTTLSDQSNHRSSDTKFGAHSFEWALGYKKNFKKEDQELDILYVGNYGQNAHDYFWQQTYKGAVTPYTGASGKGPGIDKETNISIDYTQPLGKGLLLETGGKLVLHTLINSAIVHTFNPNSQTYVPDATQSFSFQYDRQIYAYYLSGSFTLWHFLDVKAGGRIERTETKINYPNTSIPGYTTWVPSLSLSHHLTQDQLIKFGYSHRIERPDDELNPFYNISDPQNISTGNPLLLPELGDNFELGYNRTIDGGGNIYAALIYRDNRQDIQGYTTYYPSYKIGDSVYTNVSLNRSENIGTQRRTGIVINASIPVMDKLNIRSNVMLTDKYVGNVKDPSQSSSAFDYRINLNASWEASDKLTLELFGNYNSASNYAQGKRPQFFTYTFAFRRQFWNKKASLGFTATNPFNKYVHQVITTTGSNFTSYAVRDIPYQSFGLSFSYKFGKLLWKKKEDNTQNPLLEGN